MTTLSLNDGTGRMVDIECDGAAMLSRINELRDLGFIHFLPSGSWSFTHKASLFLLAEGPTKRGLTLKEPEVLRAQKDKASGGVHGPRSDAEPAVQPVQVPDAPPRERPPEMFKGFWWGFAVGVVLALYCAL